MRSEELAVETAVRMGCQLPYAYERYLSRVYLGRNCGEPDLTELLEARYFDSIREVRIFNRDGSWCGAYLEKEDNDCELLEVHKIENQQRFGNQLKIGRIIAFDEDGQAYVCVSRLVEWKEGVSDV